MKILIKYPTKFRINICLEQIKKYIEFANNMDDIHFIVSIDNDDIESVNNYNNIISIHKNIECFIGEPKGKIDAINRDIPSPTEFDILLLISDDMIPIVKGYDDIIRNNMKIFYPDTDGVLFFNDGYLEGILNTLVIVGTKYYQRFNYIYYNEYKSFFCDNEFMINAYELNKQTYIHDVIIKHEHPLNNKKTKYDLLYRINEKDYEIDKILFNKRIKPKHKISILICSIPERKELLDILLNKINNLIKDVSISIQILYDDSMNYDLVTKRNLLLFKCSGEYSCFIDDDDDITDEYFKILEKATTDNISYDCVSLNGGYYINNIFQKNFYHSTKYDNWSTLVDKFIRYPNHLNLIKTEISRKIKYERINNNSNREDELFSKKLFKSKLITNEFYHEIITYKYLKTDKSKFNSNVYYNENTKNNKSNIKKMNLMFLK